MELTYTITPQDYVDYSVHWGMSSQMGAAAIRRARWVGPIVVIAAFDAFVADVRRRAAESGS